MVEKNSRVLEIGAGPGSITRHLSGNLGCDVVALEVDPSAIEILRPHARVVYELDLNTSDWVDTLKEKEGLFDHVIAADVLEHVYDPWTVLAGMKSLLNDTGSVILSVPHVGHAGVAACLIDEDFDYRPWGLLDKTHIRFFGIKNIQTLYESQGLAIEQSEFVVRSPMMTEFNERWQRLPADIQSALQKNRFSHVLQVVSRAVPKERSKAAIDLMAEEVVAPDEATGRKWEKIMSRVELPEGQDHRSTFLDAATTASLRRSPSPNKKKGLFGKLFSKSR